MRRSSLQAPLRHLLAKLTLETRILTEQVCRQGCLRKALLPEWLEEAKMAGSGAEDGGSKPALGLTRRHSQWNGFGDTAREQIFGINTLTIINLGSVEWTAEKMWWGRGRVGRP